ncbi:MAG: hypothetical protein H6590_09915 [Flavobacteriales bacterium]|nr:hypothetical protein [Flavobacteriales bacterium]
MLLIIGLTGEVKAQELEDQGFYPNGRLEHTRYSIGDQVFFISYHDNGRVREIGAFLNGRPEGEWKQFTRTGRMTVRANFRDGRLEGASEFHDPDDRWSGRLVHENGVLRHGEQHDAQGYLVAQRDYR